MLLDHKTGTFYTSKYSFNPKEGTVMFEDFDAIELTRDTSSFKNAVDNFFEEEGNIDTIKEAILELTGMSDEVLDEAISTGTLDNFGGDDGAENLSDTFNYSLTEKNGE